MLLLAIGTPYTYRLLHMHGFIWSITALSHAYVSSRYSNYHAPQEMGHRLYFVASPNRT